jgi:LysM repeat protein
VILVLAGLLSMHHSVSAEDVTASLVVQTVNALRAARGLAVYQADGSLMAYAQQHAEYMATNGMTTHQHSDGSLPWEQGIQENVASGTSGLMTVDITVYQIWADEVHMHTMVGYASGRAGVGVAYGGDNVYISLDVIGSGQGDQVVVPAQPPAAGQPAAQAQIGAFPTATPLADGSIVHIVQDGDNLATIAETYGVSMAEIRALNGKAPTSNLIFPGEALLIKTAPPPTETPTITPTQPRPTRTPTPFRPTRTPAPTRTASATPQPTATVNPMVAGTEAFVENNRRLLLFGMGGLCVIGLAWVLWAGFMRKQKAE